VIKVRARRKSSTSSRNAALLLAAGWAAAACGPASGGGGTSHPLPGYCFGPDIATLTLPWYHGQPSSPTFTYSYQIKTASDPAAPLIIALPGGPGGTSINDLGIDTSDSTYASIGAIPAHYNVVFTDPRGSGCNASTGSEFPLDFFATDYLARDVLAVIAALNPSDYYLYGRSYGTVHATSLAYLIESSGVTPPKGVIIEGTVGKAFVDWNDYLSGIQTNWTRVKSLIDPGVVSQVVNTPLHYLGYSSRQWAHLIGGTLQYGELPNRGEYLALLLDPLATPGTIEEAQSKLLIDRFITGLKPKPLIATALGCRELWSTMADYDLAGGEIVPQDGDACSAAGLAMDRPYDAALLKIHAPIYYFQGDHDSASPLSGARYHFDVQTAARRTFVTIAGASHHPLDLTLKSLACTTAVWDGIVSDPAGLAAALAGCNWPSHIVLETANPL